uniref:MYM-type domain-containing protein n=1 Tax=viral metagenome TaxID=1070528 RepID=A0A6C0D2U9_9ZZZZ
MTDSNQVEVSNKEIIKKKRGRKKKGEEPVLNYQRNNITVVIEETEPEPQNEVVLKKRGRKPKGGKLILKQIEPTDHMKQVTNVILHLKCSLKDLDEHNQKISHIVTDPLSYNPEVPPAIMSYNSSDSKHFSMYDSETPATTSNIMNISSENETVEPVRQPIAYKEFDSQQNQSLCIQCATQFNQTDKDVEDDNEVNMKDINNKLKKLKLQLYKSSNPDKKSACFWCTYEYDNPSCYIPKYEMNEELFGYGSFCRPECAVAYLMQENLDDSTKFERYHLLNQMYGKIYHYKKNIKPAPSPYYLLDKFYGNLSIQEYRKLLKSEHMLLVIEKPMTRILPELHEDCEDFIMNIYGTKQVNSNQTGSYKVKRQSEKTKGPSKTTIMKENFGM